MTAAVPVLGTVVLDCPDTLALAAFYGRLLEWGQPEGDADWAWISSGSGPSIAFQKVDGYVAPTWPSQEHPQQFHLDLTVDDLGAAHQRAVEVGAKLVDDSHPTFHVFLDPAGHPFCLCAC